MASLYDLRQAEAAGRVEAAAGKPTQTLNASFSAFDYHPAKLDHGRSFLMDDYLQTGRVARRNDLGPMAHLKHDNARELLQYQTDTTVWQPKQGFTETKFHKGFMRRQGSSIPYLQERVHEGIPYLQVLAPRRGGRARRRCRAAQRVPAFLESQEQSNNAPVLRQGRRAADPSDPRNVITGMGVTKNVYHGERRHTSDHTERNMGMYADAPGGRLRDSTARFFCTPEQLPHRPARQQLLDTDGLVETKRTSTVIGVGSNPSQEIFSVGAREALNDSLYGLQRRGATSSATAADVALVESLS